MAEYEEAVYLIVEDSFDASSQSPTVPEVLKRTKAWARLLFGIVPEEYLQESFDLAFEVHDSVFPVNAYEIKNAFNNFILPRIQKQKEIEAENNPVLRCPQKIHHVTDRGEVYINLHGDTDVKAPCPFCRTEDFENWKKTEIALYGQPKTAKLPEISKSVYEPAFQKSPYQEEKLSDDEINDLGEGHNRLVDKFVEDAQTRQQLYVVYDDGAQMFKHPYRADILYSAKDIREKIESYKNILAAREVETTK